MPSLIDLFLPYQKQFFLNPKHKKLWVSGRQLGKSFTIAGILCYKALQKQNGLSLCISVNSRSASEIIKKCKQFAEAISIITNKKITYTDSFDSIKFSTGARVVSLPSTADSLRGWSCNGAVCIDEAAFIEHLDDIMQGIVPTLTRFKDADLVLCSTPAGLNGTFYETYQKAQSSEDWYVQETSIYDAINDGLKVDLESIKSLCPDEAVFQQEYCCQFAKNFGSFIDNSILDYYNEEVKFQDYFVGIDVGRHNDATAISILGRTPDSKVYLDNLILLHDTPYQEQFNIVQELNKKYKFKAGNVDGNGIGSAFAEQIQRTVNSNIKSYITTATNKTENFEYLKSQIFNHYFWIREAYKSDIEEDFRNVHKIVSESGKVSYSQTRSNGRHADIVSSIVLGFKAIHDNPINATLPISHNNFSSFGQYQRLF